MDFAKILRGYFSLFFILLNVFFSSCVETIESDETVYSNNFSNLDLLGFENGRLFVFQKDTIAGFYHNEEVAVTVKDLPRHNLLRVTIEILIHDSWDGNQFNGVSGPDVWFFGVDNQEIFRTTFSNSPCVSTYCLYQSFPDTYSRQNLPKTGAIQTNIPGLCLFGALNNYTTRYKIEKLINHKSSTARIYMDTDLMAINSPDPICDESWSLASVKVEALFVN